MSEEVGAQLWPVIEKALGGKTWEGKEVVLSAFVKFVEKGRAFYGQRPDVKSAITKIAIREAKRQNVGYRQHSVRALGQIALARVDTDMTVAIFEVADPLLSHPSQDEDMQVDGDNSKKTQEIMENTQVAAVESMFASINPSVLGADGLDNTLAKATKMAASLQTPAAGVRRALYEGLAKVFTRIAEEGQGANLAFDLAGLKSVLFGPDETTEALRSARADALKAIKHSSPLFESI